MRCDVVRNYSSCQGRVAGPSGIHPLGAVSQNGTMSGRGGWLPDLSVRFTKRRSQSDAGFFANPRPRPRNLPSAIAWKWGATLGSRPTYPILKEHDCSRAERAVRATLLAPRLAQEGLTQ